MATDPLYYEQIGENFDQWISDYDTGRRVEMIFAQLLPSLSPEDTVLEVGCGTGRITQAICDRFNNVTVNDISSVLTQKVADKMGCAALPGDLVEQSRGERNFDLVISSEVMEHTPDPLQFVAAVAGYVRPGGWIVLTTPNRLWYPVLWLANALGLRKFQGLENWVWPHQVSSVLRSEGFVNVQLTGCHLFPWQIPFSQHFLPMLDRWGSVLYPLMINFGVRAQRRE